MLRLSIRLKDHVHAALKAELPEWQKLRGPRFSLNNLCEEKLSSPVTPTQWYATGGYTTGTINTNSLVEPCYTVTYSTPVEPTGRKRGRKKADKTT